MYIAARDALLVWTSNYRICLCLQLKSNCVLATLSRSY